MAVRTATGFEVLSKTPIDSRFVVDRYEDLSRLRVYEGLEVYVKADKKSYKYIPSYEQVWVEIPDKVELNKIIESLKSVLDQTYLGILFVDELPSPEDARNNTLYLVKVKESTGNNFNEYVFDAKEKAFELVGTTSIDINGDYITSSGLELKLREYQPLINDSNKLDYSLLKNVPDFATNDSVDARINSKVSELLNGVDENLDTFKEIAEKIGNVESKIENLDFYSKSEIDEKLQNIDAKDSIKILSVPFNTSQSTTNTRAFVHNSETASIPAKSVIQDIRVVVEQPANVIQERFKLSIGDVVLLEDTNVYNEELQENVKNYVIDLTEKDSFVYDINKYFENGGTILIDIMTQNETSGEIYINYFVRK